MRIASFVKFYIILSALLFLLYSLYEFAALEKVLIFVFASLLSPYIFTELLKVRGVKYGDVVLASLERSGEFGFWSQKTSGKALAGGRIGDVIEIEYGSKMADGKITSYGGLFFPAEVNILYYQNAVKAEL